MTTLDSGFRRNDGTGKWTLLALLFLVTAAPLTAASRIDELFQKALVKESVERDLDGALTLYQQVIDQAGADPTVTAEARLRIGICSEKLGKPEEAKGFYRQILAQPTGVSSEVAQQARTNLRRIEDAGRLASARAAATQTALVNHFYPSRFSLFAGPSLLASSKGIPVMGLSAGLRFRTSDSDRPLAWFLEARGLVPFGPSEIGNQAQVFDSQGTDNASLSLKYQASIGLIGELPHGPKGTAIPEVGAGLALTATKIGYTSISSSGDKTQSTFSPYLEAGVRLFPDRIASVLMQLRYIATPYPKSVDIQSPSHSQTFNFPSSQWDVGVTLQIKIGHFVRGPRG